mmetsp:Transcript_25085/g.64771  ORF Transcript_25085/g.64771 Transcript_25085/m.64771 type:complete len:220 (+) Transcript_25085:209-868(+)
MRGLPLRDVTQAPLPSRNLPQKPPPSKRHHLQRTWAGLHQAALMHLSQQSSRDSRRDKRSSRSCQCPKSSGSNPPVPPKRPLKQQLLSFLDKGQESRMAAPAAAPASLSCPPVSKTPSAWLRQDSLLLLPGASSDPYSWGPCCWMIAGSVLWLARWARPTSRACRSSCTRSGQAACQSTRRLKWCLERSTPAPWTRCALSLLGRTHTMGQTRAWAFALA